MAPRVWLITGCSSGFGREITLQVLKGGDKVIATSRNIAKLDDLKAAGADILALDVTAGFDAIKGVMKAAHGIHGRIDILLNNAGFVPKGAIEETSPEELYAAFNTNVFGAVNVVNAVAPYMRSQRSGVIGNMSSIAAWGGGPGAGVYCTTKAAFSNLSESFTADLAPFGIKVTCIEPGYFRTDLLTAGNSTKPKNPMPEYDGTPAHAMVDGLDSINHKQPGNPVRGASVIIDVLTQSGSAEGRPIPLRLPVGPDSIVTLGDKCRSTLSLLEEWKDVVSSTNHDDVA